MKQLNPAHPGGILKRNYLDHYDLSANSVATLLKVSPSTLNRVINEKSSISAEMAIRISAVFGGNPDFWLTLQLNYDLASAQKSLKGEKFKTIEDFINEEDKAQLKIA